MNSIRQELNSSQVLASLRQEGERGLDPALESRLLERVELSIAGLALPALSGISGTGKTLSKASLADNYAASLALHPMATLVGTLALGGLLGALAHSGYVNSRGLRHEPSVNRVEIAAAAPSASGTSILPPIPIVAIDQLPAIPTALVKSSERAPLPAHPPAGKDVELGPKPVTADNTVSLAEQLAQLELARTALSNKDAATALRELNAHAHRYPKSPLTEEREALTIKGLLLANRVGEARAKLAEFERQFPNSLMLPALRESIGTFP